MREITTHKVKPDETIRILALDQPGVGGANAVYIITGQDGSKHPFANDFAEAGYAAIGSAEFYAICFQVGNPAEACNGTTIETLLAICADKLEGHQRSQFACAENATALTNIVAALNTLKGRTARRIAQGTEGTHTPEVAAAPTPASDDIRTTTSGMNFEEKQALLVKLEMRLGGLVRFYDHDRIWHHPVDGREHYRIDVEGNPVSEPAKAPAPAIPPEDTPERRDLILKLMGKLGGDVWIETRDGVEVIVHFPINVENAQSYLIDTEGNRL